MLRPPIRVARPADWTGRLAFAGVWFLLVVAAVIAMLVKLPQAWVEPVRYPVVLRLGMLAFALLVLRVLATVVYTRLPHAVYLSGRTLYFRERGKRCRLPLQQIAAIDVELRPAPAHEMFVVREHDGREHDLCPVRWPGAGRMYAAVARRIGPRVPERQPHQ